jgi:hypothetical protein
MATNPALPEAQVGPAEKLLELVLSSSAHLWHNRPGIEVGGVWQPRPAKEDKSGSIEGAIEKSKEALSPILAGFPAEMLHRATFDPLGTGMEAKASSRAGVQHILQRVKAGGGTAHAAALRVLHKDGTALLELKS